MSTNSKEWMGLGTNLTKILKTHHQFIRTRFAASAAPVTVYINVPFIPTKLIVRDVSYKADVAETRISLIRCHNLIKSGEGILTTFCDLSFGNVDSEHTMDFSVQGNYTFEFFDVAGNLMANRTGDLVIDLEFQQ
jgi:hypothetical protein